MLLFKPHFVHFCDMNSFQQQDLDCETAEDRFGYSVAFSSNRIFVAAGALGINVDVAV